MNERIRELAKLADEYANSLYSIHGESMKGLYQDSAYEKFAELIVRECCNVLQGEDIRYGGYGYNQGFLHKKIKQHFGVEE